MGVHGLWKLIEPSGKVVPLETLEGKVLAVDISIWLHQAVKGYQDHKGASMPNAHLLTIYKRLCKLLYFRIKPVFVFDGGVPVLKKQTIAKRNQLKSRNQSEANSIQKQLISTLLKHTAVSKVLDEKTKAAFSAHVKKTTKNRDESDDLFVLPPSQAGYESSGSESDCEYSTSGTEPSPTKYFNIHDIDEKSVQFRSLPADVRHEILTDLKDTRKQSSWGRIHELPKQSDDFSIYQMKRLLKRQSIQTSLEEAEQEMGGASLSLHELESLLNDHGVITEDKGQRIAKDENTRYLYIKDVKKTLEIARLKLKEQEQLKIVEENEILDVADETKSFEIETDIELQRDLETAIQLSLQVEDEPVFQLASHKSQDLALEDKEIQEAIKLSLQDIPSTSGCFTAVTSTEIKSSQESNTSMSSLEDSTTATSSQLSQSTPLDFSNYLQTLNDSDFDTDDEPQQKEEKLTTAKTFSAARNYMMEYGGLTQAGVAEILGQTEAEKDLKTLKANKNPEVLTAIETNKTNDNILIMSESESSESDEDFVEVHEEQVVKEVEVEVEKKHAKETNGIEIIFDTKEVLVDDMFSDIFEQTPEVTKKPAETQENIPQAQETTSIVIQDQEILTEKTPSNLVQELLPQKATDNNKTSTPSVTVEDLQKLKSVLGQQQNELIHNRGSKERLATNITDQMYQEAQELLQLFGIPYIIAPMEAEAQCAFLNEIGLTNGTITDDSDIWLFGGQTVYKNFFNNDKQVLEFRAEVIQQHLKLSRSKMISLALLVGSDYTTGIQGIGPVTALEVLAAFPPRSDHEIIPTMEEFRKWFASGMKVHGRGKAYLRNKLKNIELHQGFPSFNVIQAYLQPLVETSKEAFAWGKPQQQSLIDYAREKFGWTSKKVNETLDPVLKKLADNKAQKRIHDYFDRVFREPVSSIDIQSKLSKRVKKALDNFDKPLINSMSSLSSDENEDFQEDDILKKTKKLTKAKNKDIKQQVNKQLKNIEKEKVKKPRLEDLHRPEIILQKKMAESSRLQNRLKAIEVFRKSKKGPGFVKKGTKIVRKPKEDAELSESDSNSE